MSASAFAGTVRSILVDTSTDLRMQALANNVRRVDAILFTHTHADHVFGIDEVPVSQILDEFWERILHWAQQHGGVRHWDRDDRASYQAKIEADGYKAWDISSSIGFAGFVIAKSIADVTDEFTQTA